MLITNLPLKTIPLLEIDNYTILSFEKKPLHVLDLHVYLQRFWTGWLWAHFHSKPNGLAKTYPNKYQSKINADVACMTKFIIS